MEAVVRELLRRNALLTWLGLAHLALFAVLVALMLIDARTLLNEALWLKPAKFALSISVYLLTIAWLVGELRLARRLVWGVVFLIAASMLTEQVLITMQAARETTSHYNFTTVFDARVFTIMGYAIGTNTLAAAVLLALFFVGSAGDRLGYFWGIRFGLAIFVLGSLEGFVMVANQAHTVGAEDGGPGVPLFRWSISHGDLRVAHFLGIHAIQLLPLAGELVDRVFASKPLRPGVVIGLSGAYAAICWLAFTAAQQGKPGFG